MLHLAAFPLILASSLALLSRRRVFGLTSQRAVGALLTGCGLLLAGRRREPAGLKAPRARTVEEIAENLRQAEGDLDLPGEA
jgi:hypothetical protein